MTQSHSTIISRVYYAHINGLVMSLIFWLVWLGDDFASLRQFLKEWGTDKKIVLLCRWSCCWHSAGTSQCYLRPTSSWCSWSKCQGESGCPRLLSNHFVLDVISCFTSITLFMSYLLYRKMCWGNLCCIIWWCVCTFWRFCVPSSITESNMLHCCTSRQ